MAGSTAKRLVQLCQIPNLDLDCPTQEPTALHRWQDISRDVDVIVLVLRQAMIFG
jgi:hypothetical protein